MGLPTLAVSSRASSSPCSSTWAANRRSSRARSAGATARHAGPAARDRATAASTSSTPCSGNLGDGRLGGRVHHRRSPSLIRGSPRSVHADGRAGTVGCPGRGHQGLEEPAVAALLGVPLDPDDEPMAGQLDRLDHPVLAPGRRRPGRAPSAADGLVVAAQDLEPLAEQPADRRSPLRS